MVVLLVGILVVFTITTGALVELLRSQQRANARREDLLVNQIMHLAGSTWQAPPSEEKPPPAAADPEGDRFVSRPEILPEY